MTTEKKERPAADTIAPDAVERYLRDNPEFFAGRETLLEEITIPHPTGAAVSLVERQVAVLRDQNRRYRRQLQELIDIARTNEDLLQRVQRLTLDIMASADMPQMLATLEDNLRAHFQADAASLLLFAEPSLVPLAQPEEGFLRVALLDPDDLPEEIDRLLAGGAPVCGRFRGERLAAIFGPCAHEVASSAIMPLVISAGGPRSLGLLAIGSRDDERFRPAMGTVYLRHLAELIAHRLAALVPEPLTA